MEKEVNIPSFDKKIIYGTLNHQEKKKNQLIIFSHGLTSNKDNHIMCFAARKFSKEYDCYRFDFYNHKLRARKLIEADVSTHTKDLNSVIKHFSKEYEKIHLVGHSFGGTAIYNCNLEKIDAICLWDTMLIEEESKLDEKYEWNKKLNCYILHQAIDVLISKKLVEERQKQTPEILKKINKPTLVICAENFKFSKLWESNIKKINSKTKFIEIKGANHIFSKEKEEKKLLRETLKWIREN